MGITALFVDRVDFHAGFLQLGGLPLHRAAGQKNRRWVLWGLIYLVPFLYEVAARASTAVWPEEWDRQGSVPGLLIVSLYFVVGVVSVVHAFRVRKEYLVRLDVLSRRWDVPDTSKGAEWRLLNSLWIGWTFTLGFLSWIAFFYIGLRARHPRWRLWSLLYAAPPLLFFFALSVKGLQGWQLDLTGYSTLIVGAVSVAHAFAVRREYLFHLAMLQRERSYVSVTSRGMRWERLHSLWTGWTFALGLTSWVAFLYIGLRTGRLSWLLWGAFYFAVFWAYALAAGLTGPGSQVTQTVLSVMVIVGVGSIAHALSVRSDYLVRLEARMQESWEADAVLRRQADAILATKVEDPPGAERPKAPAPVTPPTQKQDMDRKSGTGDVTGTSPATSRRGQNPSEPPMVERPEADVALEAYPLPIAFNWSLVEGLWDPRDRYREQLRLAENMLALLGLVSLALLDTRHYEEAKIDPKVPWQGGISFGGWKEIVQRSAKVFRTHEDNPLTLDIYMALPRFHGLFAFKPQPLLPF